MGDTARACIDGLQRPWWHGWLGRSFQYGLPVRLERAWRTRQQDEFKDVYIDVSPLHPPTRAQSSMATRQPSTTILCGRHLQSTYHTVFIANLSVRPECFQTGTRVGRTVVTSCMDEMPNYLKQATPI